MKKPQVIAFYLPQFYPTPENDKWWGEGFTEWTNVAKARPLFKGHYQPKLPGKLGFYDLRLPETREAQADLAREAGVDAFCYWHYWFNGRRLLDRVFTEVVDSGKPDFPFCLCWANHSWYQKTWDPNKPNRLLMEQTYPGEQDYIAHFKAMLPAFMDHRYMRIDGKLVFGIFEPDAIPSFALMKEIWNRLAVENGLQGFYFFGLAQGEARAHMIVKEKYDAVVYDNMATVYDRNWSLTRRALDKILHRPHVIRYEDYVKETIAYFKEHPQYIPCLVPNFDHSPRSGLKGIILHKSTPQKWERLFNAVYEQQVKKESPLLVIKSWNEWGEGNYLEPDEIFGKAYLEIIRKVKNQF